MKTENKTGKYQVDGTTVKYGGKHYQDGEEIELPEDLAKTLSVIPLVITKDSGPGDFLNSILKENIPDIEKYLEENEVSLEDTEKLLEMENAKDDPRSTLIPVLDDAIETAKEKKLLKIIDKTVIFGMGTGSIEADISELDAGELNILKEAEEKDKNREPVLKVINAAIEKLKDNK